MPRRPRGRARARGRKSVATIATRTRLQKQREMRKKERVVKQVQVASTANRTLLPRPEGILRRLLLPRPETNDQQLVAPSSSVAKNINNDGIKNIEPELGPTKKVYILGPDSILYEAIVSTELDGSDIQKIIIPNLRAPIQIPTLVCVNKDSNEVAKGSDENQPNSSPNSGTKFDADTPVEEIQVKVELPEFICNEEETSENSDDEMTQDDENPVGDRGTADEVCDSQSTKEELMDEDDGNEDNISTIIKAEEVIIEDDPLESAQSEEEFPESDYHDSNTLQNSVPAYPRKVPLRPNRTDDSMYCDECDEDFDDDCPDHGPLLVVDDTPVTAKISDKLRAKKTAPPVVSIADSGLPGLGSGVWARDVIPARTRFGPFDGKIVSADACTPHTWLIRLNGKPGYCIDAGEPGLSNWMRYVGVARRAGQQNLRPFQRFGKLYFRTTRQIDPFEELLLEDDTAPQKHADSKKFDSHEWEESSVSNPGNAGSNSSTVFTEPNLQIKTEEIDSSDEETASCSEEWQESSRSNVVNVGVSHGSGSPNFSEENLFSCTICKAHFRFEDTLNNHLKTHSEAYQVSCSVCSERFFNEAALRKHQEMHSSIPTASFFPIMQDLERECSKGKGNRYICSLCNTCFLNEDSLKEHVQTHTDSNRLWCDKCHESFTDYRTLMRHMQVHKGAKKKDGSICRVFSSPVVVELIKDAMADSKRGSRWICMLCNAWFLYEDSLKHHLLNHVEDSKFRCAHCTELFSHYPTLIAHLEVHKDTSLSCYICKKEFRVISALNRHLATHEGLPLNCPFCDERFEEWALLEDHQRKRHPQSKKFVCDICHELFIDGNLYREHLAAHKKGDQFVCAVCGDCFDQERGLFGHMRAHKGLQNVVCAQCDVKFASQSEAQEHLRKMSHEVKCWECNERFTEITLLVFHQKRHISGIPFKCTVCQASFTRKLYLTKHALLHKTTDTPFNCRFCSERFQNVRHLRTHIRTQHEETTCLQTWKSWEAWKNQETNSQSAVARNNCGIGYTEANGES